MRFVASGLFLLAHGLLVLEHIALGTALHGVAEVFLAPWALRHRAWDLIVIGLIFCVFDPVSYTHLRAHETRGNLVCRLVGEKK